MTSELEAILKSAQTIAEDAVAAPSDHTVEPLALVCERMGKALRVACERLVVTTEMLSNYNRCSDPERLEDVLAALKGEG